MKEIKNEPEAHRERREKQVLDNFSAEIELLELRSESQEEKYTQIDTKMIEEIEKRTSGQLRQILLNLWQQDCDRNADISKKRWESRSLPWLTRYMEDFKKKNENKNPFIKEVDETKQHRTYAQIPADNNDRIQPPQTAEGGTPTPRTIIPNPQPQTNEWQIVHLRRNAPNKPTRNIPQTTSAIPRNGNPNTAARNNQPNEFKNNTQQLRVGFSRNSQNSKKQGAALHPGNAANTQRQQNNPGWNNGQKYFWDRLKNHQYIHSKNQR